MGNLWKGKRAKGWGCLQAMYVRKACHFGLPRTRTLVELGSHGKMCPRKKIYACIPQRTIGHPWLKRPSHMLVLILRLCSSFYFCFIVINMILYILGIWKLVMFKETIVMADWFVLILDYNIILYIYISINNTLIPSFTLTIRKHKPTLSK